MEDKQKTSPVRTAVRNGFSIALAVLLILAILAISGVILLLRGPALYGWIRFGIEPVHSAADADGDLLDDYTDIMLNARRYIRSNPEYVSDYFADGYPPEGQGVCTDVIWRAFKGAGYDLKSMIDEDIAAHPSSYYLPEGLPDTNIDFRRVPNLDTFFKRHCVTLTNDPTIVDQWHAGDFVIYDGHIAVVSDRRNAKGQPWIIHHMGSGPLEADMLDYRPILGHYRWQLIDEDDASDPDAAQS